MYLYVSMDENKWILKLNTCNSKHIHVDFLFFAMCACDCVLYVTWVISPTQWGKYNKIHDKKREMSKYTMKI